MQSLQNSTTRMALLWHPYITKIVVESLHNKATYHAGHSRFLWSSARISHCERVKQLVGERGMTVFSRRSLTVNRIFPSFCVAYDSIPTHKVIFCKSCCPLSFIDSQNQGKSMYASEYAAMQLVIHKRRRLYEEFERKQKRQGHSNERQDLLKMIRKDAGTLEYLSELYKNDEEIVLEAIKSTSPRYISPLRFASERLRSDREVVQRAIQLNAHSILHASAELQSDREVVLAAIQSDGNLVQCFPANMLADGELVLQALRYAG